MVWWEIKNTVFKCFFHLNFDLLRSGVQLNHWQCYRIAEEPVPNAILERRHRLHLSKFGSVGSVRAIERSNSWVWCRRYRRHQEPVPDIIWVQIIWQNLFDKLLFSYDKMLIFKSVKWSTKKAKDNYLFIKRKLRMLNTWEVGLWKISAL